MSIGALNPCPFRVGGGPTAAEKAYRVTRNAVGKGGSAANDSGIDGLWRRSKAKGLAAASSAKRRALLQAFPHLATDALPSYERTLGIVPSGNETQRRAVVVPRWVRRPGRSIPDLEASLKAIDARFSLLHPSNETAATTQFGRAFGPLHSSLESPEFGLDGYSAYPNYSTDFIVRVLFDVGYSGGLTPADERLRESARVLLRSSLQSWVDFTIVTSVGFLTGISPVELTALGA